MLRIFTAVFFLIPFIAGLLAGKIIDRKGPLLGSAVLALATGLFLVIFVVEDLNASFQQMLMFCGGLILSGLGAGVVVERLFAWCFRRNPTT